ncbi:MAG: hypothetical protein IT320_13130 [Anaerolineae bacterium]|nr:hypothetical protein [Anaerolineae bacterium]
MEMPFHLKTLPSEALDILRFFAEHNENVAHTNAMIDGTGLNERRFGVALRRLVTKGYLIMDGYQTYRLSDNGRRAVDDLAAYDESEPEAAQAANESRIITRRLVLVVPRTLLSGQPTNVFVGFDEPEDTEYIEEPLNLLIRMQVVNSSEDINPNKDSAMLLDNKAARQVFEIIAGAYTKLRLRCFVYQIENEEDAPTMAGGMYVDLNIAATPESVDRSLTAYGVDVQFMVRS